MFSEFLSQNILWVGAFALVANLLILSFLKGGPKGVAKITALSLPQLQRGGKSVIIDVNAPATFASAHIPDAINYPLSTINADNAALMKLSNKTVIIVCQTGSISNKAAKQLLSLGFTDLHVLQGGLLAWTKENLPVTAG